MERGHLTAKIEIALIFIDSLKDLIDPKPETIDDFANNPKTVV